MTVIERGLTESSGDNVLATYGRVETVKSNVNRFISFTHPQVVGPNPIKGVSSCPRMCTLGIGISRVDPNYVFEIFEDGS